MRLCLHIEIAGNREKTVEHLPDRQFAHRLAARWFSNRAQCCREFIYIVIARHILRLEMDFCHALIIARG